MIALFGQPSIDILGGIEPIHDAIVTLFPLNQKKNISEMNDVAIMRQIVTHTMAIIDLGECPTTIKIAPMSQRFDRISDFGDQPTIDAINSTEAVVDCFLARDREHEMPYTG